MCQRGMCQRIWGFEFLRLMGHALAIRFWGTMVLHGSINSKRVPASKPVLITELLASSGYSQLDCLSCHRPQVCSKALFQNRQKPQQAPVAPDANAQPTRTGASQAMGKCIVGRLGVHVETTTPKYTIKTLNQEGSLPPFPIIKHQVEGGNISRGALLCTWHRSCFSCGAVKGLNLSWHNVTEQGFPYDGNSVSF